MATNFLLFYVQKGASRYHQPMWGFINLNTGLNFNKKNCEIRVQVNKADMARYIFQVKKQVQSAEPEFIESNIRMHQYLPFCHRAQGLP